MILSVLLLISTNAYSQTEIFLSVDGIDSISMVEVESVIKHRFELIKTGFFTAVDTAVNEDQIKVTFKGWKPSSEQIQMLLTTVGDLELLLLGERPVLLFTQNDVIDAQGLVKDGVAMLLVKINSTAAEQMGVRTHNAKGQQVELRWDGQLHSRLLIGGPMSHLISLTVESKQQAKLMAAVLLSGQLPTGVRVTVIP